MPNLTDRGIAKYRKQAMDQSKAIVLNDVGRRGAGSLRVRFTPGGKVLYYFRHKTDAGRDDYPIPNSENLTLAEARSEYDKLSILYRSGVKNIRLHTEAEQRAADAQLRRQDEERRKQESGNLEALTTAYVDYLRDQNKPSWKDVASMVKLHIISPFPDLAKMRASDISPRDLGVIFDRLQGKGYTRALGKVRAVLHSAFNLSSRAEYDATIPTAFRGFCVATNPAAPLPTYSKLSKPGERVLSTSELCTLLNVLHNDGRILSKALLIGIYLGGQRPTQLLRVTAKDVDIERGIITLRDGKGRRTTPRLHILPLETVEQWILECLRINREAPSLFSSDGKTIPWTDTLSGVVQTISEGAYQLKDVRRTCETELARLGVSKDIRAQILSHELGGVQARHYDRHTYMDEKRDALKKWRAYLHGLAAGNVVNLRRGI